MLRILLSLLMALVATGCGPRYVDFFPYHDDGTCKPCVALIPLIDCSNSGLCWNLNDEVTEEMRYRMMDNGDLYLLPVKKVDESLAKLGDVDYFGKDLSFTKEFSRCEFVVVMELVEHTMTPFQKGDLPPDCLKNSRRCPSNVLQMKVRLKIIDLRGDCPNITLQEILCCKYPIPKFSECFDYTRQPWPCEGYSRSPYYSAHKKLATDIVDRIESVTWTAR